MVKSTKLLTQKLNIRFTKHKSCYNNKDKNNKNNSVNILFDETMQVAIEYRKRKKNEKIKI
jgi:hypothetical protein